eukprot:768691-Hanusia_phi.AAC.1
MTACTGSARISKAAQLTEQGTALHACQHSPSSYTQSTLPCQHSPFLPPPPPLLLTWLEGATCDRLLAAKHPDDFPVLHSHQPQLLVLSSHTEDPPLGVKRAARDFGTPQLTHRLLVLLRKRQTEGT